MCIFVRKAFGNTCSLLMVETIYMIYIKPAWKSISVLLILYAVMLLLLWRAKILAANNALAIANMIKLTVNLFCTWIKHKKTSDRETLLFTLGITFFAGCDYAILARTIFAPPHPLYSIAAFIVWTCYVPAQILLLRSYVEKLRF